MVVVLLNEVTMKNRIKNLDTFRAIAAIVVMIGHIELFRQNNWGSSLFNIVPSGHTAVMMFFVISGRYTPPLSVTEDPALGRQRMARRSMIPTPQSSTRATAVRTRMPAITVLMSKTPSA